MVKILPTVQKTGNNQQWTVISLVQIGSATDEFFLDGALYKCQITNTVTLTVYFFASSDNAFIQVSINSGLFG